MLSGIMEWVKNIVYFSIFAVLVRNLLPGEKYTGYVKLYTGFLMLLLFLMPALKLFDADVTLEYLLRMANLDQTLEQNLALTEINEYSNYERQRQEYTLAMEETVRSYLDAELQAELEQEGYELGGTQVDWNLKEEGEKVEITGITVYLRQRKAEDRLLEDEKTAQVKIGKIAVEVFLDEAATEIAVEDSKASQQIKSLLSKVYHVKEGNIAVMQQEGETG